MCYFILFCVWVLIAALFPFHVAVVAVPIGLAHVLVFRQLELDFE